MKIRMFEPRRVHFVSLIAPLMIACSGSTEPEGGCDDCGTGEVQFARATVTPNNGTIARGGSVNTTVNYSVASNMRIASITIQRQFTGITVTQTSTQGSGSNITRAYAISADNSVPVGVHVINFTIGPDGATSTVQHTPGQFSLTVTQ